MRWYSKAVLAALFLAIVPVSAMADICVSSPAPEKSDQARAEQLRLQAVERAQRESDRRDWEVKMFKVKDLLDDRWSTDNYRSLCIFRVEVVLQPTLKVVQIRAPKELMPTIEAAIKGLDMPAPPPPPPYAPPRAKSVEVTAYILVAAGTADPKWMPVPRELQSVAEQLKGILPNDPIYLADTVIGRGRENEKIEVSGDTRLIGVIRIRAGDKPVIGIDGLHVESNGGGFTTAVDVPVGTQVVVAKASSSLPAPVGQSNRRTLLLVLSAKILD